ncbi:class II glutamine amidotransferase [Thermococcus sp.]|uniref:class II glutamine amidotransferase n=1 Tax=Thermococcus sp. TaxID=35749 RepID=UPI0026329898|nr:class II glutamine amidotransferase [Thermococcus sp.]
MCRILFAMGDGDELKPLAEALRKSAEYDPYRERKSGKTSHADGWGYVILREDGIAHYRSPRPIFEDERGFSGLLDNLRGEAVLMAHARAASQGAKSLFNAQPLSFSSRKGFSFWFSHNGDLDKETVIERAGFEREHFEETSDSYAFSAYLCRLLDGPSVESLIEHYSFGASVSRTTFNTMTLFLMPDGSWKAFITAYMSPTYYHNALHRDYAKLIKLSRPFAIASSTLELYHGADWVEIPNGTAYLIEPGRFENLKLG